MFLGQKPIGEWAFRHLLARKGGRVHAKAACSNSSSEGVWHGSAGIYQDCPSDIIFIDAEEATASRLLSIIEAEEINLLLSVQHPRIIAKDVIDAVGGFAFNLHLAPLPKYRGFYASNHAILNGDETFGVTLHWMDEGVDSGDIAISESFEVSATDTAMTLYRRSEKSGEKAFSKFIDVLEAGEIPPRIPQTGKGAFYGQNSLDDLRAIKTPNDLTEVNTKARAFYFPPFEGAYILQNGKKKYVEPGFEGKSI